MENREEILQKLKRAGFKLTPQRLAVIEFLEGNTSHPSADIIFQEVRRKYPMISFSTVYNTLKTLTEIGEIQQLTIKENRINFDPDIDSHHHFFCEECEKIKDIHHDIDKGGDFKHLEDHFIKKYHIYFYGICSKCLGKAS